MIKPVKKETLHNYLNDSNNFTKFMQILNINIKSTLKSIGMQELDKGKYYENKKFGQNQLNTSNLNVWRGFKLSIVPLNNEFCLQVDICSRVIRSETLLDVIYPQLK